MVWDLGHIGDFEDIWLNQRLGGTPPLERKYSEMFDAVKNPRPTRASLHLPSGQELFRFLTAVRSRRLEILSRLDRPVEEGDLDPAFVYEMVAVHEEQHQETLLQALQLLEGGSFVPGLRRRLPKARVVKQDMVLVPTGSFDMGSEGASFAYDNELARHRIELDDFWIDRFPVTCRDFAMFVDQGGYDSSEFWSPSGWDWKVEHGADAPPNWTRCDGQWQVRFMDRIETLPAMKPVVHVSFYEADAYARFVGKRLPTEAEWEKAALWDPLESRSRTYPWGDQPPTRTLANLDQLGYGPAEIGAFPLGASALGVEQLIGDVWEWTSSDFTAYPGFRAFPYPEYSEIFFGEEYKVLKGGSWATRPRVARGTFRNWDFPVRRQIFSGIRCASDSK
jgi:iron(II)-dependent oxidoreductase